MKLTEGRDLTLKHVIETYGYFSGPLIIDFENEKAVVPEAHWLRARFVIEPSFGGYKRTYDFQGFRLIGVWPSQHLHDNVWNCGVDLGFFSNDPRASKYPVNQQGGTPCLIRMQ